MTLHNFRSVLMHEPLPPADDSGFLILQGALAPRHKQERAKYWESLDELQEQFQMALDFLHLPRPTKIVSMDSDPDKPPTKLLLEYASSRQAFQTLLQWRQYRYSPRDLFTSRHDEWTFGGKALQATWLTTRPLPAESWERTNPPKFRRLLPRQGEDLARIETEREVTRFVYVSKLLSSSSTQDDSVWNEPNRICQAIRSVFDKFDSTQDGVEVFLSKKLTQHCHVGFRTAADAQRALRELQEQVVVWEIIDESNEVQKLTSDPLFVDYASITSRSLAKVQAKRTGVEPPKGEPSRSECTSTTDHVTVEGLYLVKDFITPTQEERLMALLTGPHAPWAPAQDTPTVGRQIARKVQHYGYVFDYQTANILHDRTQPDAMCPALPQVSHEGNDWDILATIIDEVRQHTFENSQSYRSHNQMTVNHYRPGEGIGSHIDTPSAFADGLISVSLNSGLVMEFRRGEHKKLVYLPRRSMLCMSGPARYEWEHMITTRTTDTVEGRVIPRGTRVSLTLRTALDPNGNILPLVQSREYPPRWSTSASPAEGSSNALKAPQCEKDHVHAFYDAVSKQWHHTRGRRGVLWPGATQFLQRVPSGSLVADVGCGDGKYFPVILESGSYVIGTDISEPLLRTAIDLQNDDEIADQRKVSPNRLHLKKRPAVTAADCLNLPLLSNSSDAAICIAVLHHLSTKERRIRCLQELARIVKPGGFINVQAWALTQEKDCKRKFAVSDVFVPFNAQPKYLDLQPSTVDDESARSVAQKYSSAFDNTEYDDRKGLVVFQRYCHMYKEGELEALVNEVPELQVVDRGFESGNYFVIMQVCGE